MKVSKKKNDHSELNFSGFIGDEKGIEHALYIQIEPPKESKSQEQVKLVRQKENSSSPPKKKKKKNYEHISDVSDVEPVPKTDGQIL